MTRNSAKSRIRREVVSERQPDCDVQRDQDANHDQNDNAERTDFRSVICAPDCAQPLSAGNKLNNINMIGIILAEGVGFEPTVPLQARRFSRPVP
jgi:hypothetical protein